MNMLSIEEIEAWMTVWSLFWYAESCHRIIITQRDSSRHIAARTASCKQ